MGTIIRAELSKKNKWWIGKHRYYELKHFCLQVPEWKQRLSELDGYFVRSAGERVRESAEKDPVEALAEKRERWTRCICMVEQCAKDTDGLIAPYILVGVTEGLSYEKLRARYGVPCCKDVYYGLYREFFWRLDRARE